MRWNPFTLAALGALLLVLAPGAELGLAALPLPQEPLACLGETRSLIVSSGMPYTPVRVQGRTGFFVVDLGADGSAISPGTFLKGCVPFRGVKAEARMPWSEGEQSRVTGCHSGGADAPHSSTMNRDD